MSNSVAMCASESFHFCVAAAKEEQKKNESTEKVITIVYVVTIVNKNTSAATSINCQATTQSHYSNCHLLC